MSAAGVTRARHLVELRRYAEARSALAVLLAADPDDAGLHGLIAQALLGVEDHRTALQHANHAVRLRPDDEWGHRLAALALVGLDQREDAVRAALEAVRLEPGLWQTHQVLALASLRLPGGLDRARAAAVRAVELAPHEPEAHFAVGVVTARRGETETARAAYEQVLRLDPNHAMAHNNLTVLRGHRRLGRAAQGYARSLRSDPGSALVQRNVEVLAARFAWRVYLGGLVAFLVGVVVAVGSGDRVSPGSVAVAVLTVTGVTTYVVVLGRQVPRGVRQFVGQRLLRDPYLCCRSVLALAMLVLTLVACLVPHGDAVALALLQPVGLLNVGLAIWSRVRRRPS